MRQLLFAYQGNSDLLYFDYARSRAAIPAANGNFQVKML